MRERFLVATVLVAACGGHTVDVSPDAASADGGATDASMRVDRRMADGSAMASAHSGSRLKARWSQAPDGRRVFLGWLDSQLGVTCSFGLAADGAYRCLPAGAAAVTTPFNFADAGCTQPVILAGRTVPAIDLDAICLPVSFIVQYDFTRCNAGRRIFHLGPEIAGHTYSEIGGCVPTAVVPGTTAFTFGDEVPPATFVGAQRRGFFYAYGDALQRIAYDADDGAQELTGWQTAESPTACRLLALHDGRVHCVTSSIPPAVSIFVDGSCSMPAAATTSCGMPIAYSEVPDPGVCPAVYGVHRVGGSLQSQWSTSTGTCRAVTSIGSAYAAIGAEVSPDTFPVLDVVNEPAGRLRRRLESVGGHPAFVSGWFDADRGVPCRAIAFGDTFRCAPVLYTGRTDVYADSGCTTPLTSQTKGRCPDAFTFDIDRNACPARLRLFSVGAPYAGPVFVRDTDRSVDPPRDTCTSYDPFPGDDFYALTPVPESDLPALTVVVD